MEIGDESLTFTLGPVGGLIGAIAGGLSGGEIEAKDTPNKGIWRSAYQALRGGILVGLACVLAIEVLAVLNTQF